MKNPFLCDHLCGWNFLQYFIFPPWDFFSLFWEKKLCQGPFSLEYQICLIVNDTRERKSINFASERKYWDISSLCFHWWQGLNTDHTQTLLAFSFSLSITWMCRLNNAGKIWANMWKQTTFFCHVNAFLNFPAKRKIMQCKAEVKTT